MEGAAGLVAVFGGAGVGRMEDGELGVHLAGPHGEIDVRAARDALAALVRWVRSIEISDGDAEQETWVLSRLALGSLDCAVRPSPDGGPRGSRVLRSAWSGATSLVAAPGIPSGWSDASIESLLKLSELVKFRGVEAVTLRTGGRDLPLDTVLQTNARQSLYGARNSLGSVRGSVVRYVNDRNRRELRVRERGTEHVVTVDFPVELDREILMAMVDKNELLIHGSVRRNREGQKVSVSAEWVEQIPGSRPPEPARSMVGALGPDWTGGLTSTEWVRSQRDQES